MTPKKMRRGTDPAVQPGWRLYEQITSQIRKSIDQGRTYEEACALISGVDQSIKEFITEDVLKIIIAEEHFGIGTDMDDLALYLGLPYEKIESSRAALVGDMLREAAVTAPISSRMTH